MSKEQSRSPPTPRSRSSSVRMEKSESGSSRNSDSPIHWETLEGSGSQKITKIRPSSWDISDDELPEALEKGNLKSHIYSSESCTNRRSVTAEINELKKQFFHSAVIETETEIEDLREKLEMSLKNDRRQTPARVRRRTKSSSSSSTVMDITGQNSPKRDEEFIPFETILDNMENISPFLELDSKFYLDNFFAELRHKRINKLETTVVIANERDEEDFHEIALDDSDELVNLSDAGYYNRTFRKLSQILEVEENKKDSDKDAEECSENNDLFLRFSRKSEDSDYSPLQTARSKKDEKLFENLKKNEYKFKSSSVRLENTKKDKNTRACFSERRSKDIANEFGNEVISLTAKTGTIHLNTPKCQDVGKDHSVFHQTLDDDDDDVVNWTLIENLKLDLMKSSENPNSENNSTRERNSGSGSRKSTRSECLQSPKFKINIGKDSARSLKVEDVKTPSSLGKNIAACSDRSIKNKKNGCFSTEQEAEKNLLVDIKSLSLGSHTSNRSLELQDILLDQGINTSRYSQRSNCVNEPTDQVKSSNRTDMPYGFNHSDQSSRSINSKSSRSSRSYRIFSSRANESRMSSQRSDQFESLERLESRKSSPANPRTELELLRQSNPHRIEKTCEYSVSNKESMKSTPKDIQTATVQNSSSRTEDSHVESEDNFEGFDNSQNIPRLDTSEWIDVEKMEVISSNRLEKFLKSQSSSRSEIIISESLDKANPNNSEEDLGQSYKSSSRKSVTTERSDNLDHMNSNKSAKNKSRLDSCTSEEKILFNIPLNNERNYEAKTSDRSTGRSGIIEEREETGSQRMKSDSESDRRLSVINEASFENIELNTTESPKKSKEASVANNEELDKERTCKSHPVSQRSVLEETLNEPKTKTEPQGLWNDLIETFGEDQNRPFNWQNNFLGFVNHSQNGSQHIEKGPSSPGTKNITFSNFESEGKEDKDEFILSGRLVKDLVRSPQNSEKMSSAKKGSLEKKEAFEKNLDLGIENNLMEKMKNDNDVQNFYYFEVEKTGNFGIGEFGDVKCWNLGVSHALEEGKPKGDGDGILWQHHLVSPTLNQENMQKDSNIMRQLRTNFKDFRNSSSKIQKSLPVNDNLNVIPFFHTLKQSKSDNCINTVEFRNYAAVDFSPGNNNKSKTQKPLVENTGKRKGKAVTYISSVQYSSSEYESDETEYLDLAFESVRRSASLTDIAAQLRKSGNETLQSNENLYNSRSRLFEKTGKGAQDRGSTNLNIFLARKKEEDKIGTKSNWLTVRQSRGKKCHRENKKTKSRLKSIIKTDSKDYLSFRSRHSIPVLNLRNSNCFQNFYKRVIGAFCLTSNSSLPTSK